jgi:hypothetical protein
MKNEGFKKAKIICEADNINQNLFMNRIIDKVEYEHNKKVIHYVYDHMNEMTINAIMLTIKLKTNTNDLSGCLNE